MKVRTSIIPSIVNRSRERMVVKADKEAAVALFEPSSSLCALSSAIVSEDCERRRKK